MQKGGNVNGPYRKRTEAFHNRSASHCTSLYPTLNGRKGREKNPPELKIEGVLDWKDEPFVKRMRLEKTTLLMGENKNKNKKT